MSKPKHDPRITKNGIRRLSPPLTSTIGEKFAGRREDAVNRQSSILWTPVEILVSVLANDRYKEQPSC